MTPQDILVVGAGPAGLAASACLRRAGLAHQVVEREATVGSRWRQHYDRLHLHTAKQYSALPGSPWPRSAPRYPARDEVVEYLERYAVQHAVAPHFGVDVQRVRRVSDRFEVRTGHGTLSPRFVVMASGYNRVAQTPQGLGLEAFGGDLVHARDYRNPAPYLGRRTLVVGCGNSGAEIALDLAEHGVEVSMVVRGPVHVVPRDLLGRPTQETGIWLAALPLALRDAIVGAVMRVAVGDLGRWGIERPREGLNRMIEETGRVPILDVGTIAQVKAGRIRVRPAIAAVQADRVRFTDGRSEPFDAIVLATGYLPDLAPLVDGFAAIADARGRPHRFGAATGIEGLYFVGYRNPPTGALREIGREAPRVAAAIAAACRR